MGWVWVQPSLGNPHPPMRIVFESPAVWAEKRLKPNQVGLFATGLLVAVAEGLDSWEVVVAVCP